MTEQTICLTRTLFTRFDYPNWRPHLINTWYKFSNIKNSVFYCDKLLTKCQKLSGCLEKTKEWVSSWDNLSLEILMCDDLWRYRHVKTDDFQTWHLLMCKKFYTHFYTSTTGIKIRKNSFERGSMSGLIQDMGQQVGYHSKEI